MRTSDEHIWAVGDAAEVKVRVRAPEGYRATGLRERCCHFRDTAFHLPDGLPLRASPSRPPPCRTG